MLSVFVSLIMAPPAFSVLAAELPEFNPDFAPGMEGMDEGASATLGLSVSADKARLHPNQT